VNQWEDIGTILPAPRDAAFKLYGKLMRDERFPATSGSQSLPQSSNPADTTKTLPGDVNGDGVIDARDLVEMTTLLGSGVGR
jgi:hypothetical protein